MIRLQSQFLSMAADFTGKYAPWRAVSLFPHDGGVMIAASDNGAITFLAWDAQGYCPAPVAIVVPRDLATAAKAIKSASREVIIEDADAEVSTSCSATVTTYYSKHSASKAFSLARSTEPIPPYWQILPSLVEMRRTSQDRSRTAGRYDSALLQRGIKVLGDEALVDMYCIGEEGPLWLQRRDISAMALIMPCSVEQAPMAPMPPWLETFPGHQQ